MGLFFNKKVTRTHGHQIVKYSEQIEALINAALADGVLSEKEKQTLFKKAQAEGIDPDEFEMVLNARSLEKIKARKSTRKSERKKVFQVLLKFLPVILATLVVICECVFLDWSNGALIFVSIVSFLLIIVVGYVILFFVDLFMPF